MPVAIEVKDVEMTGDDTRDDSQVPATVVNSNNNRRRRHHAVISLDPGVRTFMSGYDADGRTAEWGKDSMRHITALCEVLDDMQSRWSQVHVRARKRYRLRKAARRVRLRIRNMIDDLHRRLAKWLCESYRVVLLPVFETSRMVRKGFRRRLRSKTARAMCVHPVALSVPRAPAGQGARVPRVPHRAHGGGALHVEDVRRVRLAAPQARRRQGVPLRRAGVWCGL